MLAHCKQMLEHSDDTLSHILYIVPCEDRPAFIVYILQIIFKISCCFLVRYIFSVIETSSE